jgi:hypothetical protein
MPTIQITSVSKLNKQTPQSGLPEKKLPVLSQIMHIPAFDTLLDP